MDGNLFQNRLGRSLKAILLLSMSLSLSLVSFTLLPSTALAQSFYGSIVGTVADQSGSVVPGASVTVTNLATNEVRTLTTDEAGTYRALNLVPGSYKIEVQAQKFKKYVLNGATVQVDSALRVDANLEVGAVSDSVEVTSTAPLLQTESGTIGSVVEGKLVQQMPLNGRNVMNLLALVPGVVPQANTAGAPANNAIIHTYVNGWGNYSIGGGIANESAQYVDGATNNMLGGNPPALVMTQDMVQEFKVESGSVSAEYGHFGGGVVNMVSKSGTNAWHGSLYEYLRNTVLNANDFVSNANGLPKSPWHQNQYGATIGGPIKKDKAFFNFSWENYSLHKAQGQAFYVPTMAMRGEDPAFPGGAVVNKPVSSANCPGILHFGDAGAPSGLTAGQAFIPSSCLSKVANVMKGFYAYPNMPLDSHGHNFADQPLTGDDAYQYNVRVDYNLSDKQRIFGRYTRWHLQDIGEDDFKGHAGNNIPSDFGSTGNLTNSIVLGDTITFTPNTVGDIRFAYTRDHFWNYGSAHNSFDVSQFGTPAWTSLATQLSNKQTPIFGLIGGDGFAGPWNIPVGANQEDITEAFSLNYNLTRVAGKHVLKFGGESMLRNHSGIGNYAWLAGQTMYFGFGPTNDEWASFMLGEFAFDNFHTVKNSFTINKSNGLYVTDNWRATPKLSVNLGLRWDMPGGIYEKRDRATVFLPTVVDQNNNLPGTLALTNSPLYKSRNFSPVKWALFGPRLGFAYSINSSLVARGGYGLSYIPPDMPIGLMAFNSPVSGVDTFCPGGVAGNNWDNPCASRGNTLIQPYGRTDLNPGHIFYNTFLQSPVPTDNYPYMQQWNLALSKQWKGDMLTEFQYVGSTGTNLPSSGLGTGTGGSYTSIDQLDPKYYSMGVAALSATAPCAKLGGASVSVAQCLQPFPQYTGVLDTGTNNGGQDYHAFHAIFSKRFHSGGVINAHYTYSHTEGNTDQPGFGGGGYVQNFYDLKSEWSVASFDVKHRAIINYVLDLPFGKDRKWLNEGGVLNQIVGGWQVNGITTLQSGLPYQFTYDSPNQLLFNSPNNNAVANNWGAGIARPNILTGCNLNTSDSWFDKYQNNNFFNKQCLVPAGFTSYSDWQAALANPAFDWDKINMLFGNAPRNSDAVRGQALINFDFAVAKTFRIREGMNLNFKTEFFNLFNHPVFANAQSVIGDATVDHTNAQFPMANTPRLIQLGLRLTF